MDFNKERTCSNKFIELTNEVGNKFLINANSILTVTNVDFGDRFRVFIHVSPDKYEEVKESYEEVCNLIKEICW